MYNLIKTSLLPPASLFFLLAFLTIAMWWKRAASRRWLICLTVIVVLFYIASTPAITRLLIGSLEWSYPRQQALPDHADAIVVLGGGNRYYGPGDLPAYASDDASVNRMLHAAKIYRELGGCPIIVSGKDYPSEEAPDQPTDNAEDPFTRNCAARLLLDIGVKRDDIILEETSRNTYDNILESQKIAQQQGFKDIVLVTDAAHMYRAELCCQKLGLEARPFPCNYYAQALQFRADNFLPNPRGFKESHFALREYLGIVWYWLKGRI